MPSGRRKRTDCTCGCAGRLRPMLFVLATGRSGSTSLLWFLNSLPGIDLAGENAGIGNLIVLLSEAIGQTERNRHLSAWSNSFDGPSVQCSLVRLILRIINPDPAARIVGFKSIRIVQHAERLATLLPCARFIVNVRGNLNAQRHSSFFRLRSRAAERDQLRNNTEALLSFAARKPSTRFVLRTEELTRYGFESLLHWLAPLDSAAEIGPPSEHRFNAAAHSPCPTFFNRSAHRVIPAADPCSRCPSRLLRDFEQTGASSRSGPPYRPTYGNCTVLRAPRVDGVATRDDIARWQPRDAQHEGIVRCTG